MCHDADVGSGAVVEEAVGEGAEGVGGDGVWGCGVSHGVVVMGFIWWQRCGVRMGMGWFRGVSFRGSGVNEGEVWGNGGWGFRGGESVSFYAPCGLARLKGVKKKTAAMEIIRFNVLHCASGCNTGGGKVRYGEVV